MLKTLISRQSLNPSFWGNNLVVVSAVLEPQDHCLSSCGFFPPGIRKILSFFFFPYFPEICSSAEGSLERWIWTAGLRARGCPAPLLVVWMLMTLLRSLGVPWGEEVMNLGKTVKKTCPLAFLQLPSMGITCCSLSLLIFAVVIRGSATSVLCSR